MTIIASIQRPEGILTVSDLMLSAEGRDPKPSVDLPLRGQDFLWPPDASHGTEASLVGMAQRTVLLEPNGMALWAGSYVIASSVLKDLAAAYAQDQRRHP